MSTNMPSVSVSQFTEIVKMQFEEGNTRPIFGLGKGGIGKTESIMSLARDDLKVGYVDVRLLLYSEVDLKGIPYPNSDNTRTIWLQNNILPRADKDGERGILVFDEITSCARSVRTAAYQLLNERRLGEYVLPNGWMIVCLGNGEEDGGDFQGMEGNFANRCSVFNVIPNTQAWKEWAYKNNINPLVLGYISWRPEELHTYDFEHSEDFLFASPRSWKAVSDILNSRGFNENDTITNMRIIANVGQRVGQHFLSFCRYKEYTVNPEDILLGKQVSSLDDNIEILIITLQSVVKMMGEELSLDIKNTDNISDNTIIKCANGIKWILSLKSLEYQTMGIKDFTTMNRSNTRKLIQDPRFIKYCPELLNYANKNAGVFMA